eukprot:CAMPEP_0177470210 /NCGR_PEP_ID=MMETSP0369-20130122/20077_1 /TAXON_ID=447022 ORGANISM="Scrippsiella hangoei-like, Strain SHHI-4" /NCGR_SAMPLE_ID=MMETSP0369 /ASSEMBLY_ACC=CAM_ASM_000364 /LENGTH=88 /DNA_ID=CAMNT_0018944649 /DNA_START=129 /DNA_END=396 /DNA_ORIENTATION=+
MPEKCAAQQQSPLLLLGFVDVLDVQTQSVLRLEALAALLALEGAMFSTILSSCARTALGRCGAQGWGGGAGTAGGAMALTARKEGRIS